LLQDKLPLSNASRVRNAYKKAQGLQSR